MMTVVCGGNGAIIMITMEKIAVDEALSLSPSFRQNIKKTNDTKFQVIRLFRFFVA